MKVTEGAPGLQDRIDFKEPLSSPKTTWCFQENEMDRDVVRA